MESTAFEADGAGVRWRGDGEVVSVQPWGRDAVRVRARRMADVLDPDWALLSQPDVPATLAVDGDRAVLEVGGLRVTMTHTAAYDHKAGHDTFRCQLAFATHDGTVLLRERPRGGSLDLSARDFRPHLGGDMALAASFVADPDERLWGMGQYQDGLGNLKGAHLELAHRNSQSSVPYVISSAGYGFLWHNPAIGSVTFGSNVTQWRAETTRQLDYWVTAGDTPADLMRAYADATGHSPMMPERGLGLWQSKLRYWNQQQLLEVAREYHRRAIPLEVIVADFFHWPRMGDFRFEAEFWPDPQAMVDELTQLGIELTVSVWPQIAHDSENYAELRRRNLLIGSERGPDVHMSFQGPSSFLDVTNPEAREFVWAKCRENYGRYGIRTFWLDEAEPEYGRYQFDNYRYWAGTNLQVGNLYPQHYSAAFFDGATSEGEREVVNLVRCAWAGSQRYGALVWSGDITSSWSDLRKQIVAGVHMGCAGIPWWTSDIGGFHNGAVDDPAFHELLARWLQFGTFCPVMRLHGDRTPTEPVRAADGTARLPSGAANEPWSFGEPLLTVFRRHIELRERLRPYLRHVMRLAHTDGQPVMRGLFHEFPDDPAGWTITDQYLLGPDLLVAPVTRPGVTERAMHLPNGARWVDPRDGATYAGGRSIVAPAPPDSIPVLIREGASSDVVDAFARR